MTDHDSELLFARAGAALRAPHPRDAAEIEALVRRVGAAPVVHVMPARAWLPWWVGIAAAGVAFVIGLGVGRTGGARTTVASTGGRPTLVSQVASIGGGEQSIAFVFVAPAARKVSLVGDFNGWDASATPLQRTDGRNTWSIAVRLPPGRHVYAFVIDGATWVADPQAPLAPEQWFGQRNSVIVIPEDRRS
ncbi:MAG TPA: isoamylase early set domain-containing protein [Gemmatimonadaceae bacterium]|nr:isoamylase early set domain-containing protein [Gemmatimonadaceae bacterium]